MLETRLDLAPPAVGFGPGVADLLIQVHNFWIAPSLRSNLQSRRLHGHIGFAKPTGFLGAARSTVNGLGLLSAIVRQLKLDCQ
jgi:hypothetical protein